MINKTVPQHVPPPGAHASNESVKINIKIKKRFTAHSSSEVRG